MFTVPKNFSWADDLVDSPKLRLTEEDIDWGYIAEVDLEFPEEVHDYLKDYPRAPSKEVVELSDFSEYERCEK